MTAPSTSSPAAFEGMVRLRRLDRPDGPAMAALIAQCNTGTTRFHVLRPDPWALGTFFGPTVTVGAFVDSTLVGTAALSWQPRWFQGRLRPVGYLHDLRVRADLRGQRIGLCLGRELRRIAPALTPADATPFCIGTVLTDNPVETQIATGTGSLFGRPQRIGQTAHIVLPPQPSSHRRGCTVKTLDHATWHRFNTTTAPQPTDALAVDTDTVLNRSLDGLDAKLGLYRDGKLVATTCLMDERARRVIVGPNGPLSLRYLSLTRTLAPLTTADWLTLASAAEGHADLVAFAVDAQSPAAAELPVAIHSATYAFGGQDLDVAATHPELLFI